ncbi:MAG TPA: penicillin-binding protein 1C [Chthoniobacterales bacterium]
MKLRHLIFRFLMIFIGGMVVVAALEIALRLTPFPKALEKPAPLSAEFLDRNGRPLRILLVDQKRYSRHTALTDISPRVIQATLSAEDKRFYHHNGIDFLAIGRAVRSAITTGKTMSGASTITQQLVKIATPNNPKSRSVFQKFREMWLALRVERAWSKDRILEEYINRVDFGNLQSGIGSASHFYYGKPPLDLSIGEAAFLAGLPKAPSRLDPHRHFPDTRERQKWVLGRMLANGFLDQDAFDSATETPLQLRPPAREFEAPHFVDLLLQRRGILPHHGGPITTTLDLELNRFVERAIADQLVNIADKHATSGAAVVIDNASGDVLALAGSGDYFRPGAGQVNGAWIARSPGSAIKPFTYALALETGANPATVVPDVPTEFSTATGLYRPNNYNHRFYGPVSLRFALGNSLNVAAIRALELGGGPEVLHQNLQRLGITTLGHPADYYGPGLTLGNAEVRLLELANAFSALGRLGIFRPYNLLIHNRLSSNPETRVFKTETAFLIADMLADNAARAASFGLNSWLSFDFPVACKTGTSSDYRDNWAVGYTPEFTIAVWVGNADNSPMRGITGVTGAAPIMHQVMQHLHDHRGTSWFSTPPGIQEYRVDPLTGHLASSDRLGAVLEKCSSPPPLVSPSDYDAAGRVALPAIYNEWLKSPQNGLGNLVISAESAEKLQILSPMPGSIYFVDPDLPIDNQRIPLRAEAAGKIEWSSSTLALTPSSGPATILLLKGIHIIAAKDTHTGQTATTWIDVR